MEERIAKRTLGYLDATVVPQMKKNLTIVTQFIEELRHKLSSLTYEDSPLKGAHILHGGSAYEGLSVTEDVDFDIIVVPGKPYLAENFVAHREENLFFTLEWKPRYGNKGFDDDGYLNVAAFRQRIFSELSEYISDIKLGDAIITCKTGVAALLVELHFPSGHMISMDVVPHITFHSWDQCPDLKPLNEMPHKLASYIKNLNFNKSPTMFFNLAVPWIRNDPRLCNISFALLEKKFVTSDPTVRSMVRLVKFVADRKSWKKQYRFQSYFAKRIALKYYDCLKQLGIWNGYKAILEYLYDELEDGTIDGYFIENQVTYMSNIDKTTRFRQEILDTLEMSALDVEALLRPAIQENESSNASESGYCVIL